MGTPYSDSGLHRRLAAFMTSFPDLTLPREFADDAEEKLYDRLVGRIRELHEAGFAMDEVLMHLKKRAGGKRQLAALAVIFSKQTSQCDIRRSDRPSSARQRPSLSQRHPPHPRLASAARALPPGYRSTVARRPPWSSH